MEPKTAVRTARRIRLGKPIRLTDLRPTGKPLRPGFRRDRRLFDAETVVRGSSLESRTRRGAARRIALPSVD
ncbi:hypothetical protein D8S78_08290 [Natrialba swarupiae]|nr:hypothetical protein [Natrialba swarupiae]